jgi:hypothetical protein
MDIHKDCYSAIDLTQQGGPHRRETFITLPADLTTPGLVTVWTSGGAFYVQGRHLLKRDIDPASNHADPMWLAA